MSVYIKGMEMPKMCSVCPCACEVDGSCHITGYKPTFSEWYEDGVKDCPLVEIPPHGRLRKRIVYRGEVYNAIEAARVNALDGILSDRYKDGFHDGLKRALELLANVEDAPTIIEAEEG